MSARKKRWVLADPAPPEYVASLRNVSPLVATMLYQRDIHSKPEVDAFLTAELRNGLYDPFLMKGMNEAARRIAAAIQEGEKIAVYGDFDTDGVTAVTLLYQAISAMGGQIEPYIPHRLNEGYGLNTDAIDKLIAGGTTLLITVDCGISNTREVAYAREKGLDIIVTDHHTPPEILPDAYAVVNPKQPGCEYPFKQLVGVGIAYKLVLALVKLGVKMPLRGRDLLDVVALGTVTDMGPLVDENRMLVRLGLESINSTQRPGLRALIVAAGLVQGKISSTDIGFMLGPRLNAAGRLDDAILAYDLLLADDYTAAQLLAEKLNKANRERQQLTKATQEAAREHVRDLGKDHNRIIVLDSAGYPAGLVGLVAARLVEELGRPVLMIERGEKTSRGSARSVPGFSIIDALASCDDLFERYGGHTAAAGFTIANENLPKLEERLLAYAEKQLSDEDLAAKLDIHAEVPLGALSWELLEQLSLLEPFGQSNPQPVLMSRNVYVLSANAIGTDKQHMKMRLNDGAGGPSYDAIAFRLGNMAQHFLKPRYVDIVYTLEANEWNNNRTLQLNIKDFRRTQ